MYYFFLLSRIFRPFFLVFILLCATNLIAQPIHPDRVKIKENHISSFTMYEHQQNRGLYMAGKRQYTERYDKKGRLRSKVDYTVLAGPKKTVFQYDKNNKLKFELKYDDQEIIFFKTEYEYDYGDRLKWKVLYNSRGAIENRDIYKYDSVGNLSEIVSYAQDIRVSGAEVYRYDTLSFLLETYLVTPDSKIVYKSIYKYGDKGKRISTTSWDVQDTTLTVSWQYRYDKRGKLQAEELLDWAGNPISINLFQYDRKGNLRRQIEHYYNGQGDIKYIYNYRYHKK